MLNSNGDLHQSGEVIQNYCQPFTCNDIVGYILDMSKGTL